MQALCRRPSAETQCHSMAMTGCHINMSNRRARTTKKVMHQLRQLQKATPDRSPCSCLVLLLSSSISSCAVLVGKKGPQCQAAPASPVLLFSFCRNIFGRVLLMSFLVVLLQVFISRCCQSISRCTPPVVVLFFSCPVLFSFPPLLVFSSWLAALMLSFWRCPVTACPSFVLLVCSRCFPPSSFCSFLST